MRIISVCLFTIGVLVSNLAGVHNQLNALAAIAAAEHVGVPLARQHPVQQHHVRQHGIKLALRAGAVHRPSGREAIAI